MTAEYVVPEGMPLSVFDSKYARRKADGKMQTYVDRITEVIYGNFSLQLGFLHFSQPELMKDYQRTLELACAGIMPTSGRHLQHGDADQANKIMELHTNCFHRDTRVLTLERGPVPISDLAGQTVTVKARDGHWRPALVSSHGVQALNTIEFCASNGHVSNCPISVVATPNHRWFIDHGITTDLKVGDTLEVAIHIDTNDVEGIRHGLVFGDGSAHKRRATSDTILMQGRTPVTLRLCGSKQQHLVYFQDYHVTYPTHAKGDPVVYVGMKEHWKDLPFTTDPAYLSGFIEGWWLADGSKTYARRGIEITTSNSMGAEWLKQYAAYAGYRVTGSSLHSRKAEDGSFENGQPLHSIRLTRDMPMRVKAISAADAGEVFCVEEPITGGFVLANGLLTGNCSTAMFSFMLFRLLLRGSGVGRDYSSACCRVDWDFMPDIRLVMDESHKDFKYDEFRGGFESLRDARHKYDSDSERVRWFTVDDSREGWAKTVEILETAAWQGKHANKLFIFDFSNVRPSGAPIMGLQGRPASGPLSVMRALSQIASIKGAGMAPWKQSLFIDHYIAACVQFGGARRSARMSVKHWRDRDVMEFIDIKRGGFLWSSNNSLLVDAEFWEGARKPQHSHARRVFEAAVNASYFDGTGEPGFINVDKLNTNMEGVDKITAENYIDKRIYVDLHPRTTDMIENVLGHVKKLKYPFLTNPCGEIVLSTWGGYCVIGDVCLAHCYDLVDAEDAVSLMAKFLVRTNLMKCEYKAEVIRTNRIGVALTGLHEFAWTMFGLTFLDLIDYYPAVFEPPFDKEPSEYKAHSFWMFINELRLAAMAGASELSLELGLVLPHTVTTVKPSGTISKVMDCTEGVHLPALRHYLRWVQYKYNDPELRVLADRGYPIKDISHRYPEYWCVGFPTKQRIVDLMGTENVVTADETTPEQNYHWLMLLENFWLGGPKQNNQVSYTLKYDPQTVSYLQFMDLVLQYQPLIRCCSVMPQSDWRASEAIYGYVPEQPISKEEYDEMLAGITPVSHEGYSEEQLACEGGVCPVEPDVRHISIIEGED